MCFVWVPSANPPVSEMSQKAGVGKIQHVTCLSPITDLVTAIDGSSSSFRPNTRYLVE